MNKVLLLLLTSGVLTCLGFFLIRSYGQSEYNRGYATAVSKYNEDAIFLAKKVKQNEIKIRQLNNDDLVRSYCRFVYGATYDECVRTYKFID